MTPAGLGVGTMDGSKWGRDREKGSQGPPDGGD